MVEYEHGLCVCQYCDTKFLLDGNVPLQGEKLTVVSVRFYRSYRTYDYLYDLPEWVHKGDRLVVNGFDGETEVVVTGVRRVFAAELPMPLSAYKYVLRKSERSSNVVYAV